jgi:pyruvate formate lyase activating enzyme
MRRDADPRIHRAYGGRDISKSREIDTLADRASPETLAETAASLGCRSVAFTYNDPVIFWEYAADVADACHEKGSTPSR